LIHFYLNQLIVEKHLLKKTYFVLVQNTIFILLVKQEAGEAYQALSWLDEHL